MRWALLVLLVSPLTVAFASMESNYQAGKAHANALQDHAKGAVTQGNLTNVPGFQTANPSEASFHQKGNLQDAARSSLSKSEAGQNVIETAKTRQRFAIDPTTDPLFQVKVSEVIDTFIEEQEPERTLKEEGIEKTCEESGEDIVMECHENLDIEVKKEDKVINIGIPVLNLLDSIYFNRVFSPYTNNHAMRMTIHVDQAESYLNIMRTILNHDAGFFKTKVCPVLVSWGMFNHNCDNIKKYTVASYLHPPASYNEYYKLTIYYTALQFSSEEWYSNCAIQEDLVEKGLCQYSDRFCSQGPETRVVNGLSLQRDCWQYKQRYQCKMRKDECSPLRLQGCYQTASKCKEKWQDRCWVYEQTYRCPTVKKTLKKIKTSALSLFCLSGDCHDTSYQANNEMLNVISRLSLLKKIQDDIRSQGTGNLQIFKGNTYQCSRNCVSFKDCCGGLRGWGTSLRLASCNSEEKQLAEMREKNLCHQVGTYCSKKLVGKCLSKKTSFCCFSSKFGKLLQEQGRPQLNLAWGEAKSPNCRGFTIEELSQLDLSRIDFREVFSEVMQSYQQPEMTKLQEQTRQKIEENLNQMEKGLKNTPADLRKIPGVLDGNKNAL